MFIEGKFRVFKGVCSGYLLLWCNLLLTQQKKNLTLTNDCLHLSNVICVIVLYIFKRTHVTIVCILQFNNPTFILYHRIIECR